MNLGMTLFIAIRNFVFRWKRYLLIAIAIIIGFSLITTIVGISLGALSTIQAKASRYFAGNTSITGYTWTSAGIAQPDHIIEVLRSSGLPIRTIASRTNYYNNDAALFFNGETIRQRKLIGVDFKIEGPEFEKLSFIQGSWEMLASEVGKNGILISVSAARLLGCRVGDDLTIYLTTDTGQYNTATFIVRGIFNETSLFGYVAYIRQKDLNRLLLRNAEAATDIAVYAQDGVNIERFSEKVRQTLIANQFKVFPYFSSRDDRDVELARETNSTETLAVLSENAQLAQVKHLIDALLVITYFTLGIFVAMVMVGILNTYRIQVYERTPEIGMMRALGIQRSQVRLIFLTEAGILALASSFLGLVVGILTLHYLTTIDFSFLPAAGLFLEGGKLHARMDLRLVLANILLMIISTIIAVFGPACHAANTRPADAMRTTL